MGCSAQVCPPRSLSRSKFPASKLCCVAAKDDGERPQTWEVFQVEHYGKLVYDKSRKSYGAHCDCLHHKKPCRANRVLSKLPIGYLIAWLLAGEDPECRDHEATKKQIGDEEPLSFERRLDARNWFSTLPGSNLVLDKEAEFRSAGDPDEPEILK